MKLETSIWNSKKTKVLAVITFDGVKELQDFMKELQIVEKDAGYNIISVKKGN